MPDSNEYFKSPDIDWGTLGAIFKLEAEYILYFAVGLLCLDMFYFGYLVSRIIRGKVVSSRMWWLLGIAFMVAVFFAGNWIDTMIHLEEITVDPVRKIIQ